LEKALDSVTLQGYKSIIVENCAESVFRRRSRAGSTRSGEHDEALL
jgi:hypothetical protein